MYTISKPSVYKAKSPINQSTVSCTMYMEMSRTNLSCLCAGAYNNVIVRNFLVVADSSCVRLCIAAATK